MVEARGYLISLQNVVLMCKKLRFSNDVDYIMNFHAEVFWYIVEAVLLLVSFYPSKTKLAAYKSIQAGGLLLIPLGIAVVNFVINYEFVTVLPIKSDYSLVNHFIGDSTKSNSCVIVLQPMFRPAQSVF